jgi:hypothetical protein
MLANENQWSSQHMPIFQTMCCTQSLLALGWELVSVSWGEHGRPSEALRTLIEEQA